MHPTGVFGHVAADGAGDLGRRIGGVIQAMGAAASEMARLRTPGCTTARRAWASMAMILFKRARDSTTPKR
jgi:hypothetical protein